MEESGYEALWVKPELKEEVRNEEGRNDTERLRTWKGENKSNSVDTEVVETIVEEKIQKLKERGIL